MIGTQGPGILLEDLKEIMHENKFEEEKSSLSSDLDDDERDENSIDLDKLSENFTTDKKCQIDKNLEDLIQFSRIEVEHIDKKGERIRYRVSAFEYQYIQQKMSVEFK